MKLTVPKDQASNPLMILRRAGYSAFIDPNTKEESFVLRLTAAFYPRFHVYVDDRHDKVTFDLHLDQKQPTYGSGAMHSGEYEGPTVEREIKRLESWVRAVGKEKPSVEPEGKQPIPKKSLLDWFFG